MLIMTQLLTVLISIVTTAHAVPVTYSDYSLSSDVEWVGVGYNYDTYVNFEENNNIKCYYPRISVYFSKFDVWDGAASSATLKFIADEADFDFSVMFDDFLDYDESDGCGQQCQSYEIDCCIWYNNFATVTSNFSLTPYIQSNSYDNRVYLPTDLSVYPLSVTGFIQGTASQFEMKFTIDCKQIHSDSPTQLPTALPTTVPTQPSMQPSLQPSTIPSVFPSLEPSMEPSLDPSFVPSVEPSSEPTLDPTIAMITYDHLSEILVVINSSVYGYNDIDGNKRLQNGIINGLKDASIEVRFDIISRNDIECIITQMEETTDDTVLRTDNAKNSLEYSATSVYMTVAFETEDIQMDWENDIDLIISTSQLGYNIALNWNLNDTSANSVSLLHYELITDTEDDEKESLSDINDGRKRQSLRTLTEIYTSVLTGLAVCVVVLAVAGYIDAKCLRRNDVFAVGAILVSAMYTFDIISDVVFVIQLRIKEDLDVLSLSQASGLSIILYFGSILFIILPILASIIQLQQEIKLWTYDIETKDIISTWMQQRVKLLYGLAILFGNSFAAVSICNSNLFGLNSFNMGLYRRQLTKFKNKRLYTIVLLENVPQLVIQFVYSVSTSLTEITVVSTTFTLLSILMSFMEYFTKKDILAHETVCKLEIEIISKHLGQLNKHKFGKLQNFRKDIEHEMVKILNVNLNTVELLRPKQDITGLTLSFRICNDTSWSQASELLESINESISNGYLADMLYKHWKSLNIGLKRKIKIGQIESQIISSDVNVSNDAQQRPHTIAIQSPLKSMSNHSQSSVNNVNNVNNHAYVPAAAVSVTAGAAVGAEVIASEVVSVVPAQDNTEQEGMVIGQETEQQIAEV